jgi:hypothetical protein
VLTGAQHRTSYLPNIPPHTNKKNEGKCKTKGGDFDNYGEASNSNPMRIYCSWIATRYPPCVELNCPKGKFSYVKGLTTAGHGTAVGVGGERLSKTLKIVGDKNQPQM